MEGLELMRGVTEQGNIPALTNMEGQRAIAEVQAAVIMAKRFPRDQKQAYDRIMLACQRPSLAEQAVYEYARGSTAIVGPSIRLAEAIAQNWGNIQFGIRELEQRDGESTVEAYAWDIETNTRQMKTFQVTHKRHTKKGSYKLEDPRDIYEMVANNGARRLRACILGVIPGDIVDAAVTQCEETLKAKADTSPEATKRLVEAFKVFGVTKEHLEKRLQRKLDAITAAQVIGLLKIYNSLKDGIASPADVFDIEQTKEAEKGMEGLKARLETKTDDGKQTLSQAMDGLLKIVPEFVTPLPPTIQTPATYAFCTTEEAKNETAPPLTQLPIAKEYISKVIFPKLKELGFDTKTLAEEKLKEWSSGELTTFESLDILKAEAFFVMLQEQGEKA